MGKYLFKLLTVSLWVMPIISSCVEQRIKLPHDWRIPTNSDFDREWDKWTNESPDRLLWSKRDFADFKNRLEMWRGEGPNRYLWFRADFNGDGVEDQANVLVSRDSKSMGIFAFISQNNREYKTLRLQDMGVEHILDTGIRAVFPGRYVTLCGKGGPGCGSGEPEEILLHNTSIELIFMDKSSRYFYWETLENDFRSVWISE